MNQDPLSQLHDIQMPDPISFWPPAPGWWVLGVLMLAGLVFLVIRGWRWHARRAFKRQALIEARDIYSHYQQYHDDGKLIADMSILLKRVALMRFGPAEVAALQGQDWLEFLDRVDRSAAFTQGVGSVLAEGPYRPNAEVKGQPEIFIKLCQDWIKKVA
ncbi:MAG: DUF4381 domain-containing protein [Pseudomonadota bacterium]